MIKNLKFTQLNNFFREKIKILWILFNRVKIKNFCRRGFTLIELLITIAIIAILASLVLYSALSYINKGKDATIKGKLVVLIPAGEIWYDKHNEDYAGFCNSNNSDALKAVWGDIPSQNKKCHDNDFSWAACAQLFVDSQKAYCVDNKGNSKEINNSSCSQSISNCCFSGDTNCIR